MHGGGALLLAAVALAAIALAAVAASRRRGARSAIVRVYESVVRDCASGGSWNQVWPLVATRGSPADAGGACWPGTGVIRQPAAG